MATPASAPELLRSLKRWDLAAVVINGVIGAGIFGIPSQVFGLSGAYSLFAFAACAICVSVIVLGFCEVASRFSGSGGPYLYARETFGATTGFTVGWLVWIARITSFSANCNLLPEHLDRFFPGVNAGMPRLLVLFAVVTSLAAVNYAGVRPAAHASNALAIGKLIPLAIFIIVGFFFLVPARFDFTVAPAYSNFGKSVLLLVYAFTGFEMGVIPAGEARNPREHLPRALMTGMATVVVFYILIQVVCIGTLPGLAGSKRPLSDAAASFAGTAGALMITIGIVISLAGNLNVLILSASRLIFAMSERGDLPRPLAAIHPRYRTPGYSILLTTGVMLILTLSGTFNYLMKMSTISRLVTYLATCAALPLLRRRPAAPPAAFRMPAGVWIAAAGTALSAWLLSNTTWIEVRDTAIAATIGLVLYGLNRVVFGRR